MSRPQRIHLIGICGTAMATLAALLKQRGYDVQGSDQNVYPPMSDFLAAEGIRTFAGYAPDHIDDDVDLVVVGGFKSDTLGAEATIDPGTPTRVHLRTMDGRVIATYNDSQSKRKRARRSGLRRKPGPRPRDDPRLIAQFSNRSRVQYVSLGLRGALPERPPFLIACPGSLLGFSSAVAGVHPRPITWCHAQSGIQPSAPPPVVAVLTAPVGQAETGSTL